MLASIYCKHKNAIAKGLGGGWSSIDMIFSVGMVSAPAFLTHGRVLNSPLGTRAGGVALLPAFFYHRHSGGSWL